MWTHTAAGLHARLLVIGEDELLVRQLQGSPASQGWELVVTGRGQQGLTLIEQVCPDLVLLSAPVPDLDAYELCQELRRRVGYALPILLLSSHDEVREKVAALESGADDYMLAGASKGGDQGYAVAGKEPPAVERAGAVVLALLLMLQKGGTVGSEERCSSAVGGLGRSGSQRRA